MGGEPAPAGPPVPQESDCQATTVPSRLAPTFTRAKAEGREPPVISSESRSSMYFTGLPPAVLESCAVAMPQRSGENLLPTPPPTLSWCARTLPGAIFSACAYCPGRPETPCVEQCTKRWSKLGHSAAEPCVSRQQCVITEAP